MAAPVIMIGNEKDFILNKYEKSKFIHVNNDYEINGLRLSQSDFLTLQARYEYDNFYYIFKKDENKKHHWYQFLQSNTRINNCLYCKRGKFLGLRGSRRCEICSYRMNEISDECTALTRRKRRGS